MLQLTQCNGRKVRLQPFINRILKRVFSATVEHLALNHITKHFLLLDGKPLSFAQVVELWHVDCNFR